MPERWVKSNKSKKSHIKVALDTVNERCQRFPVITISISNISKKVICAENLIPTNQGNK